MSYQVLRIEKFSKGDLGKIGAETERTAKRHRNEDAAQLLFQKIGRRFDCAMEKDDAGFQCNFQGNKNGRCL